MTARKNTVSTVQNEEKKKNSIRPLLASEIECRVGTMKPDGSGCSLLLYKDARVDMRILDEVFGNGTMMSLMGIYSVRCPFGIMKRRNG